MFLTENYYNYGQEVSPDPTYAMQIMQEATDDWNDICMKMIKLEHTAIMHNDGELLAEGVKETLTRFKNNITVLGRKLIEYLERVRVQWSKLQASIATKLINPDAIRNMKNAMDKSSDGSQAIKGGSRELEVTLPGDWSDMTTIVTNLSKATGQVTENIVKDILAGIGDDGKHTNSSSHFGDRQDFKDFGSHLQSKRNGKSLVDSDDDVETKINKILQGYHFEAYKGEETKTPLTWGHVAKAVDFLKQRPAAIKNIETMKKAVTQVEKAQIHELDKEEKPMRKNSLIILQRAFNKLIIKINKMTNVAVKICKATKGPKSETGIDSSTRSKAYENARRSGGVVSSKKLATSQNESVLDLFEW